MARSLTALQIEKLTKPGRYAVGEGVYLQISKPKAEGEQGPRSWLFRYERDKRAHWMGLGSCSLVTLAQARQKGRDARRRLLDGVDPLADRRGKRLQAAADAANAVNFREAAERYVAAHEAGWKNPKHRAQWPSTLTNYVYPVFGNLPVGEVDTALVTKVLEPIWATKPETASRVRGRIESVLDWAKVRGMRSGENPARWRGHLDKLLPSKRKVRQVKHHAALPYAQAPAFMVELRKREAATARALEFLILTAARTGEALGARWSELDLADMTWTVPAARMKAGRVHRVPLSTRAIEILESLPRAGELVFPGARSGRPLSNMALLVLLRRMGRSDVTAHGFRSTFRDWCAERTGYPREVAEAALAHTIGNEVEAAYRRGDLFEKRRRLMDEWAAYCCSPGEMRGMIVPLRSA